MGRELDDHLKSIADETKKRGRHDAFNTMTASAVGAGLAYWAWSTPAHAAFGATLFFTITAVGNRISHELFRIHAQQKASEIMTREGY